MGQNNIQKIDALTKFFTYEAAQTKIAAYLEYGGGNGKDTVFLIQLEWLNRVYQTHGENAANLLLAKFSFVLTKIFHQTDCIVRVGMDAVLIYRFGYINTAGIQRIIQMLKKSLNKSDAFFKNMEKQEMHIGVLHVGTQKNLDELMQHVEKSLAYAKKTDQVFVIDYQEEPDHTFMHYPQPIPIYNYNFQNVDTSYVTTIMNFLFGCMDINLGIEMTLARVCDYFNAQHIYIMEKNYEHDGYFIAHNWTSYDSLVENDNFKKLPLLVGDSLENIYDENNLFICRQLSDLYKYNAFLALRLEIQGAKSLVQSAIFDNGEYIGYICMVDYQKERIWTVEEMTIFSMLSKVLNMSVLQLRVKYLNHFVTNCDALTNAWNMHRFSMIAAKRMKEIHENKALITLDIKNFKYINSEYGYQCGNKILISIAQLLHSFIDEDECYARVGNDTFILLVYYHQIDYLQVRLSSLLQKIERCHTVLNHDIQIISIMGVYHIENTDESLSEMIDYANMARKSIKDSHNSSYAFFNEQIKAQNIKEHHFAQMMKQALRDEEFVIYYQPKVNIHNNRCVGLEALVRWI